MAIVGVNGKARHGCKKDRQQRRGEEWGGVFEGSKGGEAYFKLCPNTRGIVEWDVWFRRSNAGGRVYALRQARPPPKQLPQPIGNSYTASTLRSLFACTYHT